MNTVKDLLNNLLVCLFELAVGVLLLIDPVNFTLGIVIILGIILILSGIIDIVKYFRKIIFWACAESSGKM